MINTGLSVIGYYWVVLSLLASSCVLVGFYLPFWISGTLYLNGRNNTVFFGSFRRCNYPTFNVTTQQFRMENICGRYATFNDIPSIYWQISTVLILAGCILTMVLSFVLVPACCIKHIISKNSAFVVGLLQVVAALAVCSGCLVYPLGWNNPEVRDACGPHSGSYLLGTCEIGWPYIAMLIGSALLLLCAVVSLCGGRDLDPPTSYGTYRNRYQGDSTSGALPGRYSFDAEAMIDSNLRRQSADPGSTGTPTGAGPSQGHHGGRRLSAQRTFRPLNPNGTAEKRNSMDS